MFYIGVDLGQRHDHTAIAVVERADGIRAWRAPVFEGMMVRHLERVPLGTSYPAVAARLGKIVRHRELEGQCALVVDATGVGAPVVDLLRAARLECELTAVTITGGEREHFSKQIWHTPKRDLIAGVQVLLERGELRIARRRREAGSLARELADMRMIQSASGRVRLGAEGAGEHDDLVIALALACWRAKRRQNELGGRRLAGI